MFTVCYLNNGNLGKILGYLITEILGYLNNGNLGEN